MCVCVYFISYFYIYLFHSGNMKKKTDDAIYK